MHMERTAWQRCDASITLHFLKVRPPARIKILQEYAIILAL